MSSVDLDDILDSDRVPKSDPKISLELRETLRKCLEGKLNKKVNQIVINHHNSEFRRQFKTKSPISHNIVKK